jgi:hypothetical protein
MSFLALSGINRKERAKGAKIPDVFFAVFAFSAANHEELDSMHYPSSKGTMNAVETFRRTAVETFWRGAAETFHRNVSTPAFAPRGGG